MKRDCNVISIFYANHGIKIPTLSKSWRAKNEDPTGKVIVSYFRRELERTSKQRISNVIKNTFFRNLEKCSCHIIQSISQ